MFYVFRMEHFLVPRHSRSRGLLRKGAAMAIQKSRRNRHRCDNCKCEMSVNDKGHSRLHSARCHII
jgi:hypothetical protein